MELLFQAVHKNNNLLIQDIFTDIRDTVFCFVNRRIPFTSYNEINATIQYDTKLKSLLYGKMMLIETALKNIALNTIMAEINSNSIYDMYDKAVSSYKNVPPGTSEDIKKNSRTIN